MIKKKRQRLEVTEPRLYDTPYRSPQPHLWELGDDGRLKVMRLPEYRPRASRASGAVQVEFAM